MGENNQREKYPGETAEAADKPHKKRSAVDTAVRILFLLFAAATVYFGIRTAIYYLDGQEIEKEYERLRSEMEAFYNQPVETAQTTGAVETSTIAELPEVDPGSESLGLPEFDEDGMISTHQVLLSANSDCVGWIRIPGTNRINSPVVQAKDNEFYTDYSFLRTKSFHGAIFMDYRNNPRDLDQNTIIYGHNMRDGTMFAELFKYLDSGFAKKHNTFYYETNYAKISCTIFSAYVIDPKGQDIYRISFSSDAKRDEYVQKALSRSSVDFGVKFNPDQKLITLSTCDYTNEGSRLIVHAVVTSVYTAQSKQP